MFIKFILDKLPESDFVCKQLFILLHALLCPVFNIFIPVLPCLLVKMPFESHKKCIVIKPVCICFIKIIKLLIFRKSGSKFYTAFTEFLSIIFVCFMQNSEPVIIDFFVIHVIAAAPVYIFINISV